MNISDPGLSRSGHQVTSSEWQHDKNGARVEARNVWMSPNYDKKILLQDYWLSNKISFLLLIMLIQLIMLMIMLIQTYSS